MDINFTTTLGLVAGILTTIAYLPQLIKTWKSKSADDLSWTMLIVLCTGIILWLVYGFYIQDIPIIAANIVTFIFASIILVLKSNTSQKTGVSTQKSEVRRRLKAEG